MPLFSVLGAAPSRYGAKGGAGDGDSINAPATVYSGVIGIMMRGAAGVFPFGFVGKR